MRGQAFPALSLNGSGDERVQEAPEEMLKRRRTEINDKGDWCCSGLLRIPGAYFEKIKKIHFPETEMPHAVSEKTCSQLRMRLKPTGITPRKPVPDTSAKAGFSAAGGTGFDNELIPDIASLVEQRALVLIEIPVLLIQPEAGIPDEDIELVVGP